MEYTVQISELKTSRRKNEIQNFGSHNLGLIFVVLAIIQISTANNIVMMMFIKEIREW